MAGNKFRTFRRNEDSKEQRKTDIEKGSNIILKKIMKSLQRLRRMKNTEQKKC